MTVLKRVEDFILAKAKNSSCDDCFAGQLNLSVRQHANAKTRILASKKGYLRQYGRCSICGNQKLVISYENPFSDILNPLRPDGKTRQIFGTRFWGFNPEEEPFCGFVHRGTQSKLIANTKRGDLILVLGTKTKMTADSDKGRLLGLIEFERNAVNSEDFLTENSKNNENFYDEKGQFKWPFALPALRAWRFAHKPKVNEVIGRQLSMAAITDVDVLSDKEIKLVLKEKVYEVKLPPTRTTLRRSKLANNSKLKLSGSDQIGPPPSSWSKTVSRQDGPTATYLFQFGNTDVWKIGISQNPKRRCDNLNFSVPVEITKANWGIKMTQMHSNGIEAYNMEQHLLRKLEKYSKGHERVQCPRSTIEGEWISYINSKKPNP